MARFKCPCQVQCSQNQHPGKFGGALGLLSHIPQHLEETRNMEGLFCKPHSAAPLEFQNRTPMARSILSLAATKTAVMCSQALPAMGSTIRPRKLWLMPDFLLTSSMEPVRNLRALCRVLMRV